MADESRLVEIYKLFERSRILNVLFIQNINYIEVCDNYKLEMIFFAGGRTILLIYSFRFHKGYTFIFPFYNFKLL